MASFPKRGDIYIIDYNPETGMDESRPVVVVQNNVGNEYAKTIIFALIEAGTKPAYDLEIYLPKNESGLESDGIIRLDQLFTLDKNHFIQKSGSAAADTIVQLDKGLQISLGLTEF